MEIKQLEAFLAVASLGSFNAAANRLHITQPAISARIRYLETELGVALFDRAVRPVRLTGHGYRVLDYAERMVDMASEMAAIAGDQGKSAVRRVSIGLPSAIARDWAPKMVSLLRAEWPEMAIEFRIDRSPILRDMLNDGAIDMALLIGPVVDPGVRCLPLRRYEQVWIAHSASPLTARTTIAELSAHPVITYSKKSFAFVEIENALRLNGIRNYQLSSSDSSEAILSIVKEGLGVGFVLRPAAEIDIASGAVRVLTVSDLKIESHVAYYAAYKHDGTRSLGMSVAELASRTQTAPRAAEAVVG